MNSLTRIDIRPRILYLLFLAALFFIPCRASNTGGLALFFLLFSLVVDGPKTSCITLGRILPLLILVFLLTPLFYRTGEALWTVGGTVLLTTGGLGETIRMIGRFTGITVLFSLFFHSTEGDELISGLRWFGLPFRAALVINLSLRFIPEMFRLYDRVKDAHSLREESISGTGPLKGVIQRFSRVLPRLTSVLILSMKKIAPLSMALHLRGGESGRGRSCMRPLLLNRKVIRQFLVFMMIISVIITILVMNRPVWYKIAS